MSALLAPWVPVQRRVSWRSLREVVRPQRKLSSLPFVLAVAVVMALGMVGLLVLTTSLQSQAFDVRVAQREAAQLGYRLSDLQAQVAEARSATSLAQKASELGMTPNVYPVYLVLPDGRVVGTPQTTTGREVPKVKFQTPEEIQAELDAQQQAAEAKAQAEAAKKQAEAEAKAQAKAPVTGQITVVVKPGKH